MAWLMKMKREHAAPQSVEPETCQAGAINAEASAAADRIGGSTAKDLLGRWLELSELERRAFAAMTREVTASSEVIERSAIDLSSRFQKLAESAKIQISRVDAVIATARTIRVNGQDVTLSEATAFIEGVLVKLIETVLMVSKNAMRMVYSLDDLTAEVEHAGKCVGQLHAINRQIRFLALNATIEAARAGSNGAAFQVIAREIRELAGGTDTTVGTVNNFISSMSNSVGRSRDLLFEIATVDMSDHIVAKERLNELLAGMLAQSRNFNSILSDTAGASAALADTIAPLIMGLQFQDRTTQHLAHVIEAIAALADAGGELRQATHDSLPGNFQHGEIDRALLAQLIDGQTLGAVRKRFLAHLIDDVSPEYDPAPATTPDANEIELF